MNFHKCAFCVAGAVLGLKVSYTTCGLGAKYLKKWLSQCLLRNLSGLQSVVGHLTWAGCFVPGFKELIIQIELLLQQAESMWTERCMLARNRLVGIIF